MKRLLLIVLTVMILGSSLASAAGAEPMLKKYSDLSYGDTGNDLYGFIPALNSTVVRPWELTSWTGIFTFPDGKSTKFSNYDVFNVKRNVDDPNFDKENGFGLVYKSQSALGDLFDVIMKDQTVGTKQRAYFRSTFIQSADDPVFSDGNEFYYSVSRRWFLRTSGIVQRMGIQFTKTNKVSNSERQALYKVTKWPTLKATATGSNGKLKVDYTGYGVSERDIRIVATKKGAFPNLKNVVSLTGGKMIHTSDTAKKGSLSVDYEELATVLGRDIDVVIDDGYGRTAIQTLHLPDPPKPMDYIPTKLTLTEGHQLWLKWKYVGEDFKASDFVDGSGIPNIAKVEVVGPEKGKQTLQKMFSGIPAVVKSGQEFSIDLGTVNLGRTPGTYKVSVDAFVNNPSHPKRAVEYPVEAYKNNEIKANFTVKLVPVDLIAQSINATPSRIEKGNMSVITAKVKNVSIEDQKQVMIRITADDKTIYEVRKDMPANKPVSVGPVNWTGRQIGLHNMTVQVDPVNEVPDTNPGNNIASTGCTVYQRNGGGSSSGCSTSKTSTAKSSWTIPYRYIYEIAEVNRPLWKTAWVDYSEHLNVSTQINTKQGIATDQAHPKESDRESRGSWAIIPYAKQNSLNPNEVTRAGYGYELKVTTNYSTDWETKVPRGFNETARPIGGTYIGPTPGEAIAKFYDRNGNFINSIKLERTSGGNTGTAVWELPKREGVFLDGTKVWERKVYTDKDWSDGDVTVKVYVTAEGSKGHIEACTTNKLRIFGSMFDDTQNVRGRNF